MRASIRRRSSSLVPPQMPSICLVARAKSRHCAWTGQRVQTDFALFSCLAAGPTDDSGKKSSGSTDRHAPRERQSASAYLIALSLFRLVTPASRRHRRHRVHGHRSPARRRHVYSRRLRLSGTMARDMRSADCLSAAVPGRSVLPRAGRSGLSPTRSTIIVMSSMRSPAVNSINVLRMEASNWSGWLPARPASSSLSLAWK